MCHEKQQKEISLHFAELASLGYILKNANKDSFVTLDEVGMSTDYQNSLCLQLSLAQALKECTVLLSSHLKELFTQYPLGAEVEVL